MGNQKTMVKERHLVFGRKQYGCDTCEKSFQSLKYLQTHIQKKHEKKNVDSRRLNLHKVALNGNKKKHKKSKDKVGEQADFEFNPDLKIVYDEGEDDDDDDDEEIEKNENDNIGSNDDESDPLDPDLKVICVSENEEDEETQKAENCIKEEPLTYDDKRFKWMSNNNDKSFVKKEITKKMKKDLEKKMRKSIYKGLKISVLVKCP